MRALNERFRLGKYLRATLIVADFVTLNLIYFLSVMVTGTNEVFASKMFWLILNVSFIPSEWVFSGLHNTRIVYADRVVLTAFKSTLLTACVLLSLLYLLDVPEIPFVNILVLFTFLFIGISAWWLISRKLLKKARELGLNFKRVIIVGSGPTAEAVYDELNSDLGYGYRMMGVFDNKPSPAASLEDCFYGSLGDVADFVHLNRVDIVYYTLDFENKELMTRLMAVTEEEGAEFVYVPKFDRFISANFAMSSVGNLPCMTHTLSPLHLRRNKIAKRVVDLVISTSFLIVSPLIFIPIAIGIKLTSSGPVFFRQKRTGIYGSEFVCLKFRTMRVNADSDKVQATENDPRKTKFGDFLRRTSLDELPQFINVFLGNMSVVGPRPHMISHTVEYSALIDKYMVRHAVKPGITGWAQVSGYRGGTKQLWQMEKRVEYDVWYIRNWNIFLDFKIIFLTVWNGIAGDKNAY